MRSLLASGSCILLAALSAAQSIPPQDLEAAPFPNTVYPGAEDPTIHLPDNVTSPPSYPAPWMQPAPGSKWADAYTRAQNFVKQLNLAEKVNLTTGVGFVLALFLSSSVCTHTILRSHHTTTMASCSGV